MAQVSIKTQLAVFKVCATKRISWNKLEEYLCTNQDILKKQMKDELRPDLYDQLVKRVVG